MASCRLGFEEVGTIEELLYRVYLWSLSDKPVIIDLNGRWHVKNLLLIALSRLYLALKGSAPLYSTLTEAYVTQDPNVSGKIIAVSRNDLERIEDLWKGGGLALETPGTYVSSVAGALHISQLSYIIVENGKLIEEIGKVKGGLEVTTKMLIKNHMITLNPNDEELGQEVLDILEYAGLPSKRCEEAPQITSNFGLDLVVACAVRKLKKVQEEALKDPIVSRTIRLHVSSEGEVSEGLEHYATKALVVKCLAERLKDEGLADDKLLKAAPERIRVEDPDILNPAIPDVTYIDADGQLEVYEVETLSAAALDPPLYLYQKYSKTKRLKDAIKSRGQVKSVTIVLPNLTTTPLYPCELRKRLAWAANMLSKELNVKVIIAVIDLVELDTNKCKFKTISNIGGV